MSDKRGLDKWRFIMDDSSIACIPQNSTSSPRLPVPNQPSQSILPAPEIAPSTQRGPSSQSPTRIGAWYELMAPYAIRVTTILTFVIASSIHLMQTMSGSFPGFQFHLPPRLLLIMCYFLHFLCTVRMFLHLESSRACDGDCLLQPFTTSVSVSQARSLPSTENALDYALALRGGAVLMELTSDTLGIAPLSGWRHWLGYESIHQDYPDKAPPLAVLEQDVHVGYCWAFSGSHGHIALALSDAIVVTDFTIFYPHPAELTTNELRQAPKVVQLWTLVADGTPVDFGRSAAHWMRFAERNRKPSRLDGLSDSFYLIANITFAVDQGIKQTFSVNALAGMPIPVVVIEVLDNWGSDITCLYRIAIHGHILDL
ncbi:hypothetical protein GG344DRAFT_84247 [Lentinula edodes]|nr:hypothetical protein GG344DRAFT_84247 [Lentinula edodes]